MEHIQNGTGFGRHLLPKLPLLSRDFWHLMIIENFFQWWNDEICAKTFLKGHTRERAIKEGILHGQLGFILHDFLLGMQRKRGVGNHSQRRGNIKKHKFTPSNCTKSSLKVSSQKSCFIRNEFGISVAVASAILWPQNNNLKPVELYVLATLNQTHLFMARKIYWAFYLVFGIRNALIVV